MRTQFKGPPCKMFAKILPRSQREFTILLTVSKIMHLSMSSPRGGGGQAKGGDFDIF